MTLLRYVLAAPIVLLAGCADHAESSASPGESAPVTARVPPGQARPQPIAFVDSASNGAGKVTVLASEQSLNTRRIWSPLLNQASELRRRFAAAGVRAHVSARVMGSFELREGFQLTREELTKALAKRGFLVRRVVQTGAVFAFECTGAG